MLGVKPAGNHELPGGILTLTRYTYVCLPFGLYFYKFWYSDRWVFVRDQSTQFTKLGVFWHPICKIGCILRNFPKMRPIWVKLVAFLSKLVYKWVGFWSKNRYRDGRIFKVQQAHTRTKFFEEPPPPPPGMNCHGQITCWHKAVTMVMVHGILCTIKLNLNLIIVLKWN